MVITERCKRQARKALDKGYTHVEVIKNRKWFANAVQTMDLIGLLNMKTGSRAFTCGYGTWVHAASSGSTCTAGAIRYLDMMRLE